MKIKLTESKLKQIIAESVKNVLKEEYDQYFNGDFEDEKGSDGLWDYAAEVAKEIAISRNEKYPIYAEEWGQEIIYNAFQNILK